MSKLVFEPEECEVGDFLPENRLGDHEQDGPCCLVLIRKFISPSEVFNSSGECEKYQPSPSLRFEYCIFQQKDSFGHNLMIRAWRRIE